MQRKTIIWTSIISLLVIILGGITIYLQPDEFSIVLKDGTIKAKYSDGVMKVYSGRYLAYSDNIRPYYWNGKGYTKMYKSSKCGFKYSNLSQSKEGNTVYVKQDLCYSKGIVTRYFEITEYKIKKAFEFVPFEDTTRTKYKWYFENLDLGKAEIYLSKDIKGTRAVMDFGIINDWSKEIEKTVRVQRYLNGKMMIEIKPVTGNVSYDPEIILGKKIWEPIHYIGNKEVKELCKPVYKTWTEEIKHDKTCTNCFNLINYISTGKYLNETSGKYYDIIEKCYNYTCFDIEYIPHINEQVRCDKTGKVIVSGKIYSHPDWWFELIGTEVCGAHNKEGGQYAAFWRTDGSVTKCCEDLITGKITCYNSLKVDIKKVISVE